MNESIYMLADPLIEQKIGEKIRYLRLRQNKTQQQLAKETQLSLSTIKKLEKGTISSFDSFIRVIRILGKLECLVPIIEEEPLSPNEYYELTQLLHKKERKRATGTSDSRNTNTQNVESEW